MERFGLLDGHGLRDCDSHDSVIGKGKELWEDTILVYFCFRIWRFLILCQYERHVAISSLRFGLVSTQIDIFE